MPPRSKSQGESKQGLIITLVFFILATIGLGVATYFGFSEQDKLDKAAKEAKKNEEAFKAERDWYKFQTLMYLSYMGLAQGLDGVDTLATQKDQFDKGSMKGGKDKEFVSKVLKGLEKEPMNLGWNGNQPKETLTGKLDKANTERANLADQKAKVQAALDKAKKDLEAKDEELRVATKDYQDKLKALEATLRNDFDKSDKDLAQLRKDFDKLSEERKTEKENAEKEKVALNKQIEKLKTDDIKHLKERIKAQEETILAFETKSERAPASMRTDWKIIRMDTRGLNPYINLGSADHVNPQLTFTIHGIGADGRPNPQPKGTLEVVNVLAPHLSQTRITSVKNRNRDPITQGDVIYNASWNPNLKKHVAIAGIVDLTGDGRDSLYEFMRNLERQHIVVDSYLDPKEGTMKGKITFNTDFLILGELPEAGSSGKLSEQAEKIISGQKLMQEEAKKYGVQQKGLVAYLELIGYRLPPSTRESRPSLYNPDLRPDQAPRLGGDRIPPPKPANGDKEPPAPKPANGDKEPPAPKPPDK
jgi:hypothetical protein